MCCRRRFTRSTLLTSYLFNSSNVFQWSIFHRPNAILHYLPYLPLCIYHYKKILLLKGDPYSKFYIGSFKNILRIALSIGNRRWLKFSKSFWDLLKVSFTTRNECMNKSNFRLESFTDHNFVLILVSAVRMNFKNVLRKKFLSSYEMGTF